MLTGAAGLASLAAAFASRHTITFIPGVTKTVGFVLVYLGMAVAVWAACHLRGGTTGFVTPRANRLITSGPYRFVRHPIYLAITVSLVGVSLACLSWPGLVVTAAAVLPVDAYRARAEERALQERFGAEWQAYARRTPFFAPISLRPKTESTA
jgi:protein-S-isoprenylcysteine O-methyltransferase Ste14